MARAAQADIDQAVRETSIQRLVEARNVKLVRRAAQLVGQCPFHRSTKPTLSIDAKANTWSCSGKCKLRSATAIEWVMKAEGVSRHHAVELLRSGSWTSGGAIRPIKQSSIKKLSAIEHGQSDAVMMTTVIDYYHTTLKHNATALDFVKQLGFRADAVEHFRIGFVDRTLTYRLPLGNRMAGKAIRTQLQRLGILRQSGHEHFRGCLVVPIFDEKGNVQQVYGRKVGKPQRGEELELWLPGQHTLFNTAGIASPMVLLCSSVLDAITFWCAGCSSVTAGRGVDGFTDNHLAVLKAKQTERVTIAFERTDPANTAAEKLAARLAEHGMVVHRVTFPQGMSASEYLKHGPSSDRNLEALVRHAAWMAGSRPVQEQLSDSPPSQAEPVAHEVVLRFENRRWRIRGLDNNVHYERLALNILVGLEGNDGHFHVDSFDLYQARSRAVFTKLAASELGVSEETIKNDLGKVLEARQHTQIKAAEAIRPKAPEMNEREREQAMLLLRDPKLIDRILADFERCGVVGERSNKLVAYLAAVSRKLRDPLAVLVQSSSAAGKSSLVDAALAFVPEEDRFSYSAMTGQALFYAGDLGLAHKVLSISEHEGARQAVYALKLLQSDHGLRIASTGKDALTGRLTAHEYRVQGPVAIFLTTTSSDLDEELLNRCLILSVDEGHEQTQAIQAVQRQARTLEGLVARDERARIQHLHQNAQRLLVPLSVVNPFAAELTFSSTSTRARRDHTKYLGLIDSIALLHQHQRPIKSADVGAAQVRYVEATRADIDLADQLVREVMAHAADDVPPQTRHLWTVLHELVAAESTRLEKPITEFRFTRRWLRERVGWSETQMRVHTERLVQAEYLVRLRAPRDNGVLYRVLVDSTTTKPGSRGIPPGSRGARGVEVREAKSNEANNVEPVRGVVAGAQAPEAPNSASYSQVKRARRKP